MRHDWIVSVLTDLRAYATANGLPLLADQLGEAAILAQAEVAGRAAAAASAPEGERCACGD